MNTKTATYKLIDGTKYTVKYDADALCWYCERPVIEASTSGTRVCPWCDSGVTRDGSRKLTQEEEMQHIKNFRSHTGET